MKKPIFAGAGVAIVTPFKDETLKINFSLFEELINELETIVKSLESNKLSLEESVKEYQKGIEIRKFLGYNINEYLYLQGGVRNV